MKGIEIRWKKYNCLYLHMTWPSVQKNPKESTKKVNRTNR